MTLIERPRGTNEARAIATLVTAFMADPAVRWMYPDPQQYLTYFPDLVRAFGGKAFEHGTVEDAAGFRCAALWLPPGVQPDEAAVVEGKPPVSATFRSANNSASRRWAEFKTKTSPPIIPMLRPPQT